MADLSHLDMIEVKNYLVNLAEIARSFYVALVGEGFAHGEALALTETWMAETIRSAKGDG